MKKILVAEDSESFLKLLIYWLKTEGYETVSVLRGDKAIEAFTEHKPDLVILDGLLPMKNGFEVAKEIRALPEGKDVPIILLTGVYKESEFYKYSQQIGVNLHYDKSSFNEKDFLPQVKKLLTR
jgi:DNA-binding response OmpR family regulator